MQSFIYHKNMASEAKVKEYLAYWFHLGKKVIVGKTQEAICPQPVVIGEHYSSLFEDYWQYLQSDRSGDCYLEGTEQTIQQLLSPEWEIHACSRCQMPVPLKERGLPPVSCPCFDLSSWPNLELPIPHAPVRTQTHLYHLQKRLNQQQTQEEIS